MCTTIIDKDIIWYGAINTLGYATEEDNVIKVVDNKLANELLEVLLTSKFLRKQTVSPIDIQWRSIKKIMGASLLKKVGARFFF